MKDNEGVRVSRSCTETRYKSHIAVRHPTICQLIIFRQGRLVIMFRLGAQSHVLTDAGTQGRSSCMATNKDARSLTWCPNGSSMQTIRS